MARARLPIATSLAGLISDDADGHESDDFLADAPDSNQENFLPRRTGIQKLKPTATNGRVRQAVTKKPLPAKTRPTVTRKPAKKAIPEQPDNDEDVEEVDELDMEPAVASPKPKDRLTKAVRSNAVQRAAPQTYDEDAQYGSPAQQSPENQRTHNTTMSHIQPKPFYQIRSDGIDPVDPLDDFIGAPQRTLVQSSRHRRAGSASSNEGRNPDPALRRKLGEMTKKFDAMEIRYRKLHDVGLTEAKTNFDKLKASSEEKARISEELINSLKMELSAQRMITQQAEKYVNEADKHRAALADAQAQIAAARKEIAELRAEKKVLEASNNEIENDLTEAQAQIKAHGIVVKQLAESKTHAAKLSKQLSEAQTERSGLQAKLTAARAANIERQTPGSALKGQKVPVMKVMTTTAEANAAVQEAQSKVELYGDLTGLLVSRVERYPDEQIDIFDCIQTGLNGTLHYKLSVSTDTTESFDEAEFHYLPQLDKSRDQVLMELLPHYLLEEIVFSRQQAGKFYTRVSKMLAKEHEESDIEEAEE